MHQKICTEFEFKPYLLFLFSGREIKKLFIDNLGPFLLNASMLEDNNCSTIIKF